MNKAIIYIHGQGGSIEEAKHYQPIFPRDTVLGFDYQATTPWDAVEEFQTYFDTIESNYESVSILACSIGAYFAMGSLNNRHIDHAMLISPIVNMENLILRMMAQAHVREEELQQQKEIVTSSGETLSWEYLCYVRNHPIQWKIPTDILYGEKDALTPYEDMVSFATKTNAHITIMKDGEHWFHTEEEMKFLDEWIQQFV